MPVNYNQSTIDDRLKVVIAHIDAGAGNGQMRLLSSSAQTVAMIGFLKPSATVSNGVLTFSGLPLASPLTLISASVSGADIEDSTGTVVVSGLTVSGSTTTDIVMSNTMVSSGQIVTLTYATITGSLII